MLISNHRIRMLLMIFVPLPFVVAMLLFIVLIRMLRQEGWSAPEKRPFLLLIGIYALQSVLIGIRWGYDVLAIMPAQSILAAMIAALAWISFRSLTLEGSPSFARLWPHALPAVLIAGLLLFWREPMGLALILIFLGYGAALLWLARHGPDGLIASRLDGALLSYRSLLITAAALIASAISDIFISLDFDRTGGIHAGAIVALGNVIALLILGGAASIASGSQPDEEQKLETSRSPLRRCRRKKTAPLQPPSTCSDAIPPDLSRSRTQSQPHRAKDEPARPPRLDRRQPHPWRQRLAICQRVPHPLGMRSAGQDG